MSKLSEREVLLHLKKQWVHENHIRFDGKLRIPQFQLSDDQSKLGSWNTSYRLLSLQREFVYQSGWLEVLEILRHEMAHQYVNEVLHVTESPHGKVFKTVCLERGIDARAQGAPQLSTESQRILNRVKKLLALAESQETNEAELAARQAQSLIVKHHLNEHLNPIDENSLNQICAKQITEPTSRVPRYSYQIISLLSEFFFVEAIWVSAINIRTGKTGRVAEISGKIEDVEIADYVYQFLLRNMDRTWKNHRLSSGAKGLKSKNSFLLGLIAGFRAQLHAQKIENEERGLIYIGSSLVTEYFHRRYPRQRRISPQRYYATRDYQNGYDQGKKLRLQSGMSHQTGSEVRRLDAPKN